MNKYMYKKYHRIAHSKTFNIRVSSNPEILARQIESGLVNKDLKLTKMAANKNLTGNRKSK